MVDGDEPAAPPRIIALLSRATVLGEEEEERMDGLAWAAAGLHFARAAPCPMLRVADTHSLCVRARVSAQAMADFHLTPVDSDEANAHL